MGSKLSYGSWTARAMDACQAAMNKVMATPLSRQFTRTDRFYAQARINRIAGYVSQRWHYRCK